MRKITDHKVGLLNEALEIAAGPTTPGGASVNYTIRVPDALPPAAPNAVRQWHLVFHVGSPDTPNGITTESLIAIAIDRLRGHQSGPQPCRDNALALTHLEDALLRLQHRTRDRAERGVEGSHQP